MAEMPAWLACPPYLIVDLILCTALMLYIPKKGVIESIKGFVSKLKNTFNQLLETL